MYTRTMNTVRRAVVERTVRCARLGRVPGYTWLGAINHKFHVALNSGSRQVSRRKQKAGETAEMRRAGEEVVGSGCSDLRALPHRTRFQSAVRPRPTQPTQPRRPLQYVHVKGSTRVADSVVRAKRRRGLGPALAQSSAGANLGVCLACW